MKSRTVRTGSCCLVIIGSLIGLTGCAPSADPGRMIVTIQSSERAFPERLRHAMCVRSVTGGEETNPLWVSKVSNDEFRAALAASLTNAGLSAAAGECSFPMDVNLLGLSQPSAGFDMTVTSHVNYKVYNSVAQPVLLETISAPYTEPFSFSMPGFVRIGRANEGSIRASIQQFFEKVSVADLK
jgi:hypothetical protein